MNDFNQATILINIEKKTDMFNMEINAVCKNGEDVQPMEGNFLLNLLAKCHNEVVAQLEKQKEEAKLDVPSIPQKLEKEEKTDILPEDETTTENVDDTVEEDTILVPTTTTLH